MFKNLSLTKPKKDKPAKPSERIRLFVQDVIDFSSQYGKENSNSYTVANIRSRPHYYPKYGDFLESSVLRTYGPWWPSLVKIPIPAQPLFVSTDFVEVKFEHKLFIESVTIYETYNPGAICALYAFDYTGNNWVNVWSIFQENNFKSNKEACNRPLPPKKSRKFEPNLQRNVYSDKLRLEFEHSSLDYYTELDAVEIAGIAYDLPSTCKIASNLKKTADLFEGLTKSFTDIDLDENKDSLAIKSLGENIESGRKSSLVKTKSAGKEFFKRNPSITSEKNSDMVSCANLVDLPNEILCMILTYLDLKTIFRLRSTCKTFDELCTLGFLYTKLDLQPYWHLINEDFIEFLATVTEKITMLNLSWIKLKRVEPVQTLFERSCQDLTVLQLDSCMFMDGHLLTIISKNSKNLTSLSLRSCTNIENIRDETRDGFSQLKYLKKLKHLDLYRTLCGQSAICEILSSCGEIESVNLGACVKIIDFDQVMNVIAKNLSGIKSLDLWRAYSLTSAGLNELSKHCFQLEELDIGWCRSVAPIDSIQELVKNCRNIRKLFLTSLKVSDEELEMISKYSTNLERLDILGSNLVSYEGVELVLHKCQRLKMFDISFCNKINTATHRFLCEVYTQCSIKKSHQSEL